MQPLRKLDKQQITADFNALRISISSPDKILSWSHGEVTKAETINYRTFKPERDGLFCAKIFGPVTDWECLCGKYKRMKHRGVICDKCGVEVTRSRVRRERMGHIQLAAPVSHVWFFKGLPSRIGQLLDLSLKNLERVLYFESYVVIDPGATELEDGQLLSEEEYRELLETYEPEDFEAGMGAEAIRELLVRIDPDELAEELRLKMRTETSQIRKLKAAKRLKVVDAFRKSGCRPEWMILEAIPVLPPELRPLVPLDGGRFATSDLNDLYRRVINRNNRLRKLLELNAPEVIVRNEKRMLQEAVDALFDNGRRGRTLKGTNNRPLKSLSDNLKGKQGRFRQNLLGKRVDYSGRSVIVVGPTLQLHQCGLPKKMALELFKPFIYNWLEEREHVSTIKAAKELVEREEDVVWDALDEVIKDHPVLLNRAPTLHRLGIQAFEPKLIEGKAIQIHPLVCAAFNADFDGDQMAVHVPLSPKAQIESQVLMLSSQNILSPAHGKPIAVPSQDLVLGGFYLTLARDGVTGEGRMFHSPDAVVMAYDQGLVETHARIKLLYSGELLDLDQETDDQDLTRAELRQVDNEVIETTVGRVIFNEHLPEEMPYVNGLLKKRGLQDLVGYSYFRLGKPNTVQMLDKLKDVTFQYATKAGISFGLDDMVIPYTKDKILSDARKEVAEIEKQRNNGVITAGERKNKIIDIWHRVTERVSEQMFTDLRHEEDESGVPNPILVMAESGARGSREQIRQLAGMRGLMSKPSGEVIETPITANFREGLSVLQYFISTHGARKGLADTALKTADSGYLTRRLVDVAQEMIVTEQDCGTIEGLEVRAIIEGGDILESLRDRIIGRLAQEDIVDPLTGETLIAVGEMITEKAAAAIQAAGTEQVTIRSVLTCESKHGVCANCYGRDLATGKLVDLGNAIGVVAAQSIGEPGTQLTMRTFHYGGIAGRVSEQTKGFASGEGTVKFINVNWVESQAGELVVVNRNGKLVILDDEGREVERHQLTYGSHLHVREGEKVERGAELVEWDPYTSAILTEIAGSVEFVDIVEGENLREETDPVTGLTQRIIVDAITAERRSPAIVVRKGKQEKSYPLPTGSHLIVDESEKVNPGDTLVKIPRETTKTQDITGGLPRVVELFEARTPKEPAMIAEIDGVVKIAEASKGMRKIIIEDESGETRDYTVPRSVHINVQEGETVQAGDALIDGAVNPHDILQVKGEKALQEYLVAKTQEVYRSQGVTINDKHIEVIVNQMMRSMKIEEVGDTNFLVDEQVSRWRFREENKRVVEAGGEPAVGRPLLLGITKASLSTDSFFSAASFQETTRVLTEASINGAVDHLRGLKENVIVGRLIPAGTGMQHYHDHHMADEVPVEDEFEEELFLEVGDENIRTLPKEVADQEG